MPLDLFTKEINELEKNSEINRAKQKDFDSLKEIDELISDFSTKQNTKSVNKPSLILVEEAINKNKILKNILNDLSLIDKSIVELKETLSNQTKNYNFEADISNDLPAQKAVKKIFKKKSKTITKEMYLYALKRINELEKQKIKDSLDDTNV